MAVFTRLEYRDAEVLVEKYRIGSLISLEEIGQGIENSNFFLTTSSDHKTQVRYVVTIFEMFSLAELPFFIDLTDLLARKGLPVPAAIVDRHGAAIQRFHDKPLAIFPCLPGRWESLPLLWHCERLGELMARFHQATAECSLHRTQDRTIAWMEACASRLGVVRGFDASSLLHRAVDRLKSGLSSLTGCPRGIIHGDLFRDNVLFDNGRLSGVIDFYHACDDYLLFDLAVAANDWAFDEQKKGYNKALEQALIAAYEKSRPWSRDERSSWDLLLLRAALSFWISRLMSRYLPGYQGLSTQGDITKDPLPFQQRVEVALGACQRID